MTKKKPAKKQPFSPDVKAAADELYREIESLFSRRAKELADKIDSIANRVEAVEKSFWRKWW